MGLPMSQQILRLFVAFFIGLIIGIERTLSKKPAGIKTHCIICLACTLMTMLSAYGFYQFKLSTDPTRLMANIITGVGFIGGGVIIKGEQKGIKGLTTAAGIFGVAGIGIAVGLGYYFLAFTAYLFMELSIKSEKMLKFLKIIPSQHPSEDDNESRD